MAYSLIAHTIANGVTDTSVTPSAINTTGADLLVIATSSYAPTVSAGTLVFTDSKGNAWTQLGPYFFTGGADVALTIWYCFPGAKVGAGHTFTFSNPTGNGGGAIYPSMAVQAWSGSTGSSIDQQNHGSVNSGNTVQPGPITPGAPNCLVIAATADGNSPTATVTLPGYTISDQITSNALATSGGVAVAMGYQIQTLATLTNPTWTLSGSAQPTMVAFIGSFKAAAPSVTVTQRRTDVSSGTRVGSRQVVF